MAYKVVKPIPVVVSPFEGGYVAEWCEVAEWGHGNTPSDARDDLVVSIRASYDIYSKEKLGPMLEADWELMRQHITKIEP